MVRVHNEANPAPYDQELDLPSGLFLNEAAPRKVSRYLKCKYRVKLDSTGMGHNAVFLVGEEKLAQDIDQLIATFEKMLAT